MRCAARVKNLSKKKKKKVNRKLRSAQGFLKKSKRWGDRGQTLASKDHRVTLHDQGNLVVDSTVSQHGL
jgi:hypothetical protein